MANDLEALRLFREALDFAYKAHDGHLKKSDRRPYFIHPVQVAMILLCASADDPLVTAGILHDACEDGGHSLETIVAEFGPDIAALVASVTDDGSLPWRDRKKIDLERFQRSSNRARLLRAADVLANVSALVEAAVLGTDFAKQAETSLAEKIWYYDQITEALGRLWPECPLLVPIRSSLDALKARLGGVKDAKKLLSERLPR